jgi:cell division protein FtsQ
VRSLSEVAAGWRATVSGEGAFAGVRLPKMLRRPVRAIARRNWRMPRNPGTKGLLLLFLSTGVAGVMIGGHVGDVVGAVTAWSGLAVDEVKITGQSETSELDVLGKLAINSHTSLVTFDVAQARERVESLPWVKQATIRKLYPDTLQVAVVERTPFAVWQHDSTNSLIDDTGKVIVDHVDERYTDLPMVVGDGANTHAREFTDLINNFPTLKPRVRAGLRIFDRRWNVLFDNGIEAMLPQNDPDAALVQLVALDDEKQILSREVSAIDLRLPNRLVVRLTPEGEKAHEAMLKARDKAARRGKANT